MKRSEVIEVLEEYNKLLMSEGYADTDLYGESENDSAIDRFMQTDWFKSRFPLVSNKETTQKSVTSILTPILDHISITWLKLQSDSLKQKK